MTNKELIEKIWDALWTRQGNCLDQEPWEYYAVLKAILDALDIPYPKFVESFSKYPDDMSVEEQESYDALDGFYPESL